MKRELNISKGSQNSSIHICSKHEFLGQRLKYVVTNEYIKLTIADIDDNKLVVTPTLYKKTGFYSTQLSKGDLEIPFGKFEFDEDSDIDNTLIYFND